MGTNNSFSCLVLIPNIMSLEVLAIPEKNSVLATLIGFIRAVLQLKKMYCNLVKFSFFNKLGKW